MAGAKFTPRLMRQEANEELEQTRESLKDRFEKEQKVEVKIERRPIKTVMKLLVCFKNGLCIFFALLGLITMLHPELRHTFMILIQTFLMEAGIGG